MAEEPGVAQAAAYWRALLQPYMGGNNRKAAFQVASTALLFALGWFAAYKSLAISYWLTLAICVPTAGLLIRLFIFQHDCGHGAFFTSQKVNDVLGSSIGVIMLTPYRYWRRTHAIHHSTSGDLDHRDYGDINTITVKEYLARSRFGRLRYRVYRNMLIMLSVGPIYQFLLKHRWPLDMPKSWHRERRGVLLTNLALIAIVALAWLTIGIKAFLLVHIPIFMIATGTGIWLFYIQHQFEDTYWREHPDWEFHEASLQGSSLFDLPRVLHWFTGNIGFHHIHHLSSLVPNYNLARCYREVKELQKVTKLTLAGSIRCARLKLWDEDQQRLIGFGDLRRLA